MSNTNVNTDGSGNITIEICNEQPIASYINGYGLDLDNYVFSLTQAVRDSLALADSALQSESDPTVPNHVKAILQNDIDKWNSALQSSDLLPYEKTVDVDNKLSNKVNKEAGKGLSSHDFTGLLKEKLEQQRKTILISGNKFTYIPIVGNDGSSFQSGDLAKDGWIDQNTFGKLLSYKGTGDATLIENWKIIESI